MDHEQLFNILSQKPLFVNYQIPVKSITPANLGYIKPNYQQDGVNRIKKYNYKHKLK